jgi:hypothetical protein
VNPHGYAVHAQKRQQLHRRVRDEIMHDPRALWPPNAAQPFERARPSTRVTWPRGTSAIGVMMKSFMRSIVEKADPLFKLR